MGYILVSNDDGIHGAGLEPLVSALTAISQVKVVVPLENCSGASNKLTLNKPLVPKVLDNGAIVVPGTPADCVYLACQGMFETAPDFVVSGINEGANLGDDVLYSGTVAAAIEGRHLSQPSIAISLVGLDYYATAASVARYLTSCLLNKKLNTLGLLNVNVPNIPLNAIKGIAITRLGRRKRATTIALHQNPRGDFGYWIGRAGQGVVEPGTDFEAIEQGYVSVTPLTTDMTAQELYRQAGSFHQILNQEFLHFRDTTASEF